PNVFCESFFFVVFFFSCLGRHASWPRDWSSDVCSSDLAFGLGLSIAVSDRGDGRVVHNGVRDRETETERGPAGLTGEGLRRRGRSEERRVGKECKCRRVLELEKKN